MSNVDWAAVNRRLDFIEKQAQETREMVEAAATGGYSPLMSSEAFERQFALAIEATGVSAEQICMFNIPRPHRCSCCESFVEGWINRPKEVAHA